MTSDETFEFADITPQDSHAERALDLLWDSPDLADHHRSLIRVHRRTRPPDSGSELSDAEEARSLPVDYWAGHYTLSLANAPPNLASVGWRIGKGSSKHPESDTRGVDILLIRPGKRTEGVAAVHARIQFNPHSGVLMLIGVQDDRPILYTTHDAWPPVRLGAGQAHVLYQKSNSFSLGNLRYCLTFRTFLGAEYRNFVDARNALLAKCGWPAPHTALSAVPRSQDVKRSSVVTHGSYARGKFGWVSTAVHVRSGKPLVVKEQRATETRDLQRILGEIQLGATFQENLGLLPTISSWCEHERDEICGRVPDLIYSTSPLALTDGNHLEWNRFDLPQTLQFLSGPLLGLVTLHRLGCIHRDIHGGNVLITSCHPPCALLGDFGKTIKAKHDNYPHLGPRHSCAPEVDGQTLYTNKIDIWSFGFMVFNVIFPQYQRDNVVVRNRITDEWHSGAIDCLRQYSKNGNLKLQVADLLRHMLCWDPDKRITAMEALQHPCFIKEPDQPPPQVSVGNGSPHKKPRWNDQLLSSENPGSDSSGMEATTPSLQHVQEDLQRRAAGPSRQRHKPMKY
ncbi:MAG: hypothetical protein Q9201_006811 [Fulgogasparrea decipioides]